jgi:hypothetical protein
MISRVWHGWTTLAAIAVAVLAFPVYAFAWWIVVFDAAKPRGEMIARFLAGFPAPLRSTSSVTYVSAVASLVAAVLADQARRRARE